MREWQITPPLRKELLTICKKVAPDGTTIIKVPNRMSFLMRYGEEVVAYVEHPKTGVETHIWSSETGFNNPLCKDNTFLCRWLYEAAEQLKVEMEQRRRAEERERSLLACDLLGIWETRNNTEEDYGTID